MENADKVAVALTVAGTTHDSCTLSPALARVPETSSPFPGLGQPSTQL